MMNKPTHPSLRLMSGLSLVELMTAMLITLVLMAGVVQVFVANKTTYKFSEDFARGQENARYAVGAISDALRSMGYMGCQPEFVSNGLNGKGVLIAWDDDQFVQGYDGGSVPGDLSGTLPSGVTLLPGSDALTLRSVSGLGLRVQAGMSNVNDAISIPSGNGLSQGDVVMVSDCAHGAIFQITSADPDASGQLSHGSGVGSPGNESASLNKAYQEGSEVVRMTEVSFLLGMKAVDFDGDGEPENVPTLYRYRDGAARAEELVEGIEDLQLRYGIADDPSSPGAVTKYLTAAQVTAANQWDQVVAFEVGVLVASLQGDLLDTDQTVTFNGSEVDTSDRKIRQAVNITVGARNAIL